MTEVLNTDKIEYVLCHLNHHMEIKHLSGYFIKDQTKAESDRPYILFPLSSSGIIKDLKINALPVLFPLSSDSDFFYFDKVRTI